MKKSVIILLVLFSIVFPLVSAEKCTLVPTLINQDPYPASPGDYVEVVFQVTGVENPECQQVNFELVEDYPFEIQGQAKKSIMGGTFVQNYKKSWMIPYNLLVNKDAIDKEYDLKAKYSSGENGTYLEKTFKIKVEDSLADFEIYIKDYSYDTDELTFEILNIGESDAEAVTMEIPKQDNVDVRGSNTVIVGDIDSNEYTNADFTAEIADGEIKIDLYYTDAIGERRFLEKTVAYDSSYFEKRPGEQNSTSPLYYIIGVVIIIIIVWLIFKKRKKKKEQHRLHRRGMAKL